MRSSAAFLIVVALFFVFGMYFVMTNYLLSGIWNFVLSIVSMVILISSSLRKRRQILVGLVAMLFISSAFVLVNLLDR